MTDLSFDQEQLAAALERVVFEEDDVLAAGQRAQDGGAAEVGFFPMQGQAQFQIHPVLSFDDEGPQLSVLAFNDDHEPLSAEYPTPFAAVLKTRHGAVLGAGREFALSPPDVSFPVFRLTSLDQLIGAQLELVV